MARLMSDVSREAGTNLEAGSTPHALQLLIETAAANELSDDYEVTVAIGFMREIAALVEQQEKVVEAAKQTVETSGIVAGPLVRALAALSVPSGETQ